VNVSERGLLWKDETSYGVACHSGSDSFYTYGYGSGATSQSRDGLAHVKPTTKPQAILEVSNPNSVPYMLAIKAV